MNTELSHDKKFKVTFLKNSRQKQSTGAERLVEALRYKSEGHGFDSRWSYWSISLT
jgi:hypothetical protein